MKEKLRKIYYILGWVSIAIAFVLIIVSGFWLTYPYNVVSVKQPVEILNESKVINVGDAVYTRAIITKNMAIEGTMYPVIQCESGNLVTLNSTKSNLPVGNSKIEGPAFTLPPRVLSGDKCQIVATEVYQVNPLRKVSYVFVSDYFTVGDDKL